MRATHKLLLGLTKAYSDSNEEIKILDSGCGTCDLLKILNEEKFNTFGYDIYTLHKNDLYDRIIKNIVRDLAEKKVSLISIDDDLPFPDKFFDIVVTDQVLEHIENVDKYFSEIKRVLKPNGYLINNFPLIHILKEPHLKLFFVHRIPHLLRPIFIYIFSKLKWEQCKERANYILFGTHYRSLTFFKNLKYFRNSDLNHSYKLFIYKFPFLSYVEFLLKHVPVFIIPMITSVTIVYKND